MWRYAQGAIDVLRKKQMEFLIGGCGAAKNIFGFGIWTARYDMDTAKAPVLLAKFSFMRHLPALNAAATQSVRFLEYCIELVDPSSAENAVLTLLHGLVLRQSHNVLTM